MENSNTIEAEVVDSNEQPEGLVLDRGELDDDKKMLDYLNNMSDEEMKTLINKQNGKLDIPPELAKKIALMEKLKKQQLAKPKKKRDKAKAKRAKASRRRNRR